MKKKMKVKKSLFGVLKGMRPFTKEDEVNICPNIEKRFLKEEPEQ